MNRLGLGVGDLGCGGRRQLVDHGLEFGHGHALGDRHAARAGQIIPGDKLVEIDGTNVVQKTVKEIAPLILGAPGSSVVLGMSGVDGTTKAVRLTR